jgi:hypothetical protein
MFTGNLATHPLLSSKSSIEVAFARTFPDDVDRIDTVESPVTSRPSSKFNLTTHSEDSVDVHVDSIYTLPTTTPLVRVCIERLCSTTPLLNKGTDLGNRVSSSTPIQDTKSVGIPEPSSLKRIKSSSHTDDSSKNGLTLGAELGYKLLLGLSVVGLSVCPAVGRSVGMDVGEELG